MADVNVAAGQPRPEDTGSAVADRPKRQRNRRGQGSRLRDEIIAGAAALLERTGTETAITLRAVAREVGIAPPSMTPHFAERAEIIDAVEAESDPAEKAFAAARAYLAFGQAHPNRYRVIFERRFLTLWDREQRVMRHTAPQMAETFDLVVRTLQGCIDAGRSSSTDAFADGGAIWFALHGMVALPPAITSFPWPDAEKLLISCITRLARIQEPPRCG